MRTRAYFHRFIFASLWILMLFSACSSSGDAITRSDLSPAVQNVPVELNDALVDAGSPISVTAEPAASQDAPLPDGASLLARRCVQCHLAQMLEQTEKSRAEWEQALSKMESFGVELDETEKIVLLDYLAGPDSGQRTDPGSGMETGW